MLKYKLKANPIQDFSFSYVADYLKSLGIENPDSFLKEPRLEDQEHYNKLINIDKAVQSLYEGFKQNKKFFMQVDSDTDGYTSASIFFSFFTEIFPEAKIE
jgi:single-stranded DNA-specific DHH superfamily exonuclease